MTTPTRGKTAALQDRTITERWRQALAVVARQPRLIQAAIILLFWLIYLDWPEPLTPDLDPSWHAALVDAHAHDRQWGREIIFTAGPFGYLFSHFVPASGLTTKLVWEILGKLAMMTVLVGATAALAPARRLVLLIAFFLTGWMFPDATNLLLLVLVVFAWILPREGARPAWWVVALALLTLAFLAHVKFTYWILAAAGVGSGTLSAALRRDWRRALALALGYACLLVAVWMLAGQDPGRLVTFFRMSLEISAGYPWAMAQDESGVIFVCGIMAALGLLTWLAWTVRRHPDLTFAGPAGAFALAAGFMAWKHGFTRADGHVLGFFVFALLAAISWPGWFHVRRRWSGLEGVAAFALAGLWAEAPVLFTGAVGVPLGRTIASVENLVDLPAWRRAWLNRLDHERNMAALPRVRSIVGDAKIDALNYDQGTLLLNGLRYHPRPVLQGYSAYTPTLMWRNTRFLQSPRAPEYLLVRWTTIDDRYAPADDALLVAELPRWYEPLMAEGRYSLLRRRAELPEHVDQRRELQRQTNVQLGEEVELGSFLGHAAWLRVVTLPTQIGRLRAAIYRPSQLTLVLTEKGGTELRRRLLPKVAHAGFLVQPIIESQSDFDAFIAGQGQRWVESVRVEAKPGEEEFWRNAIGIEIHTLPEIPMTAIERFGAVVEAGASNLAPSAALSDLSGGLFVEEGKASIYVHAPDRVVFVPPEGVRHLRGSFGIRPRAYLEGTTDGVTFIVRAIWPDGRNVTLLDRHLAPKSDRADQGTQMLDLELPTTPGYRLELLTEPGPADHSGWDWSYWSELRFSPLAEAGEVTP